MIDWDNMSNPVHVYCYGGKFEGQKKGQCVHFIKSLNCKPQGNDKQSPAFSCEEASGSEL